MALHKDDGWIEVQSFPGDKVVKEKVCVACGLHFKTHNDAIQHVAERHVKLQQLDNGDLSVVKLARKPYNNRERVMTAESVMLYKGEPVMEARWQTHAFAQGAAWALRQNV